jgi:serine protease AprX
MSDSLKRISLAACLLAVTAYPALASPHEKASKISRDAKSALPSELVPVIIQYNMLPGDAQSALVRGHGGLVRNFLNSIRAMTASVPQSQLEDLAADPNIKYISRDRAVAARQVTITAAEYTTEPINALPVWQKGYIGTNVGVAVLDSGITPVNDLKGAPAAFAAGQPTAAKYLYLPFEPAPGMTGRIVFSANFVPTAADATDVYGHGTHVAGLIAGNGAQSTGSKDFRTFYGSAPNANLIDLKVLDDNGGGTDSSVIAGIESAILLKNLYNIRVINLSLGRPIWESYKLDPLCQAVEQAWQAGIVVVAAAGNDGRDLAYSPEGYGTIEAPGNDPYVITVGAMRSMETATVADDLVASYSSKGPTFIDDVVKPDIVAPGNLVSSLKFPNDALSVDNPSFYTMDSYYQNVKKDAVSSDYFPLSGTSMATGVVSGAVADLLQAMPNLTPDQVKAFLMRNADRKYFPATSSVTDPTTGTVFNANYDVFTVGAGYLDVNATLTDLKANAAQLPLGTAMSPVAVFNAQSAAITLATDPSTVWGSTILWGAQAIYGSNAIADVPASQLGGSTILWGANSGYAATILWGANDPAGATILWGANSQWASGTPAAATILWGANSPTSSTILWGASGPTDQTILWGATAMYEY